MKLVPAPALLVAACLGGPASANPSAAAAADTACTVTDAMVPAGDHVLSTRLFRPAGRERAPVVVLAFGSGGESMIGSTDARRLANAFAARGIATLAYDKRGTGASTGELTGSDFAALGRDAAAVVRHAHGLDGADAVGIWGISQFGWIAPTVVRECRDLAFAIVVSPAGVNPYEQVAFFLRGQALEWGLSPSEADAADRMHRAVTLYYAGRSGWRAAQDEVDRHLAAPWFHRVVTHPYWDEMTPEGRILPPDSLARAVATRPRDFEIYRAPSSFVDYRKDYRALRELPTLVVFGAADRLVPVVRSRPLFEEALRGERRHPHAFRTFDGASHDIAAADGQTAPAYLDAIADWARARFDALGATTR